MMMRMASGLPLKWSQARGLAQIRQGLRPGHQPVRAYPLGWSEVAQVNANVVVSDPDTCSPARRSPDY